MTAAFKIQTPVASTSNKDNITLSQLSEIIRKEAGILLNEEKYYLLQTRLNKRLQEIGAKTLKDYLQIIQSNKKELQIFVESMTTHKTEWFREIIHFQWLKDFLEPKIQKGEQIHIWSAASSTGEEVYSLAFLLLKLGADPQRFKILGTDISQAVLNTAQSQPQSKEFKRQKELLKKRMPQFSDADQRIEFAVKNSITFRSFNLIKDPLPQGLTFDAIFLRNVLIYFEREDVKQVCLKLSRALKPGGHLVLGLSESLHNEVPELENMGNSIYRVRGHQK